MSRLFTTRNVIMALTGAAILVLKPAYHGPLQDVFYSYAGNISVSFALYFAAINATAQYRHPQFAAAFLVVLAVELFELTNGFGFMENVYDPIDFAANAAGVALAVIVDAATHRILNRRQDPPAERTLHER